MKHEEMLMQPDEYRVMFEIEDRYWWYRGVRALLTRWLARYAQPRSMILDVGCGTGANLKLLQGYGTAIGVDISEQALSFCRARGIPHSRTFLASATDLPFPDSTFDLATSFDVICNIADDLCAFAQVARVLKPGSRFIVGLPAYQWLWGEHDVAVGHQRRYSAREVQKKMRSAGFEIERVTYANALLLPLIALMRLTVRRAPSNGSSIHSDLVPLPGVVNAPLSALFTAEMRAVSRMNLPYGLSVIAVGRKTSAVKNL
jgi:SAM-dependent methyltransferase